MKSTNFKRFFCIRCKRNQIAIRIKKWSNFYYRRFFFFVKSFYFKSLFYRLRIVSNYRIIHLRSRIFCIIYKRNCFKKYFIIWSFIKRNHVLRNLISSISSSSRTHTCGSFRQSTYQKKFFFQHFVWNFQIVFVFYFMNVKNARICNRFAGNDFFVGFYFLYFFIFCSCRSFHFCSISFFAKGIFFLLCVCQHSRK